MIHLRHTTLADPAVVCPVRLVELAGLAEHGQELVLVVNLHPVSGLGLGSVRHVARICDHGEEVGDNRHEEQEGVQVDGSETEGGGGQPGREDVMLTG